MDTREALKRGEQLNIGKYKQFLIEEEIGRGANSIVYKTIYKDYVNEAHIVILKEFFPFKISNALKRNAEKYFICEENYLEEFEQLKSKFVEAYKKNVEFGRQEGLVNSTSNAYEIYEKYHTYYVAASFDEGKNYEEYEETSLKDLLEHIYALCKVIQIWHAKGYIHLDIKPENIFVVPETTDRVILFDFDTVTSIEALRNHEVEVISFSEGFSAEEQKYGESDKIDERSDLYSIGAVLFYKLFGRVVNQMETMLFHKIRVKGVLPQYEIQSFSPQLSILLEKFFEKTLKIDRNRRWKNIDSMIEHLEKMIPLADPNAIFICSNFNYHEGIFVGREKEIQELQRKLEDGNAVFLSGIGGIGKTEIAKKYAHMHQKEFGTILFLTYSQSLEETFASDELVIQNMEHTKESTSKIFSDKLNILRSKLTSNDLIIVDNFDVEEDENLEKILNDCPCKFIFTTREDYRDYGYEQINIGRMENLDDVMKLFSEVYGEIEDLADDMEIIQKILEIMDYHTMMVSLLAKYLRESGDNPEVLYEKFLEKEGITNTDSTKIKHRKDRKLNAKKVMNHLRILFDISHFSEIEKQVLMALSLLGPIRIQEELFFSIYKNESCEEVVKRLIRNGWIEENEESKISMHQIILDLVYNDFSPNVVNSKEFTQNMICYFREKEDIYAKRKRKQNLAFHFIDRISGTGHLLAEVYYEYCYSIKWNSELLKRAKEECQREESLESEWILIHVLLLYLKKSKMDRSKLDYFEDVSKQMIVEFYQSILELEQKINFHFCRYMRMKYDIPKSEDEYDFEKYPVQEYLTDQTGDVLLQEAKNLIFVANGVYDENLIMEEAVEFGFLEFFLDSERILLYLCKTMESYSEHFSFKWKEKLYEELAKFYQIRGYMTMAQVSCVGDAEKSAYYSQRQIEMLKEKEKNKNIVYFSETSYEEAAQEAIDKKDYEKALELYCRMMEVEETLPDEVNYAMSEAYIGLKNYDKAEELLLEALEYDKQRNLEVCYTYRRLENLYEVCGKEEQAIDFCEKIIRRQQEQMDDDAIEWILRYQVKKWRLEKIDITLLPEVEINEFMSQIEKLLFKDSMDTEMEEVFVEYHKLRSKDQYRKEVLDHVHKAARKYKVHCGDKNAIHLYVKLLADKNLKQQNPNVYMECLLELADIYVDILEEDFKAAHSRITEAEKFIENNRIEDAYFDSKIRWLKIRLQERSFEVFEYPLEELRKECDFYLVAQNDIQKENLSDDVFDVWKEVAQRYMKLQDKGMVFKSFRELHSTIKEENELYHIKEFYSVVLQWCGEQEKEEGGKIIEDLHQDFVESISRYLLESQDQKEIWILFGDTSMKIRTYEEAMRFYVRAYEFVADYEEKTDECIFIMEKMEQGLEGVEEYKDARNQIAKWKEKREGSQIEFKH